MTGIQRMIKKVSIVLIFFGILFIMIWPSVSPKEDPCFNGVLDETEDEIDCGGICEKMCPPPEKPPLADDITIEWAKAIPDGKNNYILLSKVINTNRTWGTQSVKYMFTVYGENDEIIDKVSGYTFINPMGYSEGEGKKYISVQNYYNERVISKVDFKLSDFNWEEVRDASDMRQFGVDTIKIKNTRHELMIRGDGYYYAYGETLNTTKYKFNNVDIYVVLYDAENNAIGIKKTDQKTVDSGKGWEFRVFWNNELGAEVASADFVAETNIFDKTNFLQPVLTGKKYKSK